MKARLSIVVVVLFAAMSKSLAQAEEGAGEAPPRKLAEKSCPELHSRALCITRAAGLAGQLTDANAKDFAKDLKNASRDATLAVAMAGGLAGGVLRPTQGLPIGAEIAINLLGAVAANRKPPPFFGENVIVAWMPIDMAPSVDAANRLMDGLVAEATKAVFADATLTPERLDWEEDPQTGEPLTDAKSRYKVTGSRCGERECYLLRTIQVGKPGVPIGMKAELGKAPDFLGGADAYVFRLAGSAFVWQWIVDRRSRTYEYTRELSERLPSWAYVVVSPQFKRPSGRVINDGNPFPVVFNEGRPMYFAFPEVEAAEAAK